MTPDEELEVALFGCTILGGSGYSLPPGARVDAVFGHSLLWLRTPDHAQVEQILYPEITSIAITGAGRVTTGGNFIGGGFGITGALEGMAIATILNTLTTRTEIHTILEIITHRGELYLHYGQMEPGALRISLSPVFARLRQLDPIWLSESLNRLNSLRDRDILTAEQFERLKHQLTTWPGPIVETQWSDRLTRSHKDKLRSGLCPSCDAYNAFRKATGTLICERCGTKYPLDALTA